MKKKLFFVLGIALATGCVEASPLGVESSIEVTITCAGEVAEIDHRETCTSDAEAWAWDVVDEWVDRAPGCKVRGVYTMTSSLCFE